MNKSALSRRRFLNQSAQTGLAGIFASSYFPYLANAAKEAPSERFCFAAIGVGGRGAGVANNARRLSDLVAVCDLDTQRIDRVNKSLAQGKAKGYQDYRKILERKDIDFVTIGTTDHWHTRIAIHAMQAGKDVYCEKPLTLTIEEGKQISKVTKETGRVFQVGTQQRSEMGQKFLTAIGIIREGRIGKIQKVTCNIGGGPKGGPFKKSDPPANIDWDTWLGQAPKVDYIKERCHYQFRWWYEYSGGKMTDWGAHHADIAQWALGQSGDGQGVLSLDPIIGDHPIPLKNGMPTKDDHYNTSHNFHIRCMFPEDTEMNIVSKSKEGNGILFEGSKGNMFVSAENSWEKRSTDLRKTPFPPTLSWKSTREEDDQPYGKLLRLHEGQDRPDFRRSHPSPGHDYLSLGQHLDPVGQEDQMGSEKGTGHRGQGSQQMAIPQAAQGLRNDGLRSPSSSRFYLNLDTKSLFSRHWAGPIRK